MITSSLRTTTEDPNCPISSEIVPTIFIVLVLTVLFGAGESTLGDAGAILS